MKVLGNDLDWVDEVSEVQRVMEGRRREDVVVRRNS